MKIADLEAQAKELDKSLNGEDTKKEEEATPISLAHKALDLLKSVLPDGLRKAAFGMDDDKDDDDDEENGKPNFFAKKSGETKQPHGDQNTLNSGEMSSSKKIPKKFNYDAKMEDTDVDYPDNSEVPYYDEKTKVRKSFSDIQNDPDLSEEDKVFVVNDWLEKGFRQIDVLTGQVARLQKSVDAQNYATSVMLKSLAKSMEASASAPRGRISQLSVIDKPGITKKSVNGNNGSETISRMEVSQKMLKAQKAGRINYQDVALGEEYLNANQLPPAHIMSRLDD